MDDQSEGTLGTRGTSRGHGGRCGLSGSLGLSPGPLVLFGDAAGMAIGLATVPTPQIAVAWMLMTLAAIVARGHQRLGLAPSLSRDAGRIGGAVIVPGVILGGLQGSARVDATLLRSALVATVAVLTVRAIVYAVVRALRTRRVLGEPTLVVGAGPVGAEVARVLGDHPEYGSHPVGFLDDVDDEDDLLLPVLGPVSSLEAVVRSHGVRRVMVAFGPTTDAEMVEVVRACDRAAVEIHVLPRFFELGTDTTEEVWGLPFVRVGQSLCHPAARGAKRAFDVVVASLSLLMAAPVMVAVAVLVRLSSPGPILFRQARVGEHGRLVEVLKFRSMEVNDEADTQWSVATDVRVTAVGAFLRRSSLDELPQLFNVLRGDMSLVGPRPERPFYVERFSQEVTGYRHRHRAPVGMTGWSQVNGLRGDTSIEERARLDNHYIENWSPWRDVVTLARTVRALFQRGPRPAPGPEVPAKALAAAPCLSQPVGKPAA